MNPEIEQMLLALAQKFGVTVEHLWAVLIAQAKIEAGYNVAVIIVGLLYYVIAYCVWRIVYQSQTDDGEDFIDYEYATGRGICLGLTIVVGMFAFFAIFDAGYNAATQLLNPEFWALQQVIRGLK